MKYVNELTAELLAWNGHQHLGWAVELRLKIKVEN